MPSSRHHTEWLSLIEVSGPFLSVPVLERVFPQGLDAHDPDHARVLRLAFDEWEDDRDSDSPRPGDPPGVDPLRAQADARAAR